MSYTDLQNNKITLQSILETVNALPSAGNDLDTSDATIIPETVFLNETGYANGQKVTGTFTIEDEVTAQENLIAQISAALEGKAGGGSVVKENATVTFSWSANSKTYTPTVFYLHYNDDLELLPRVSMISQPNSSSTIGYSTTFYVAKNTAIFIFCTGDANNGGVDSYTVSGGIEAMPFDSIVSSIYDNNVFFINSDGTITVTMSYIVSIPSSSGGSNS